MIRAELAVVQQTAGETLPSLVDRAARALSSARTSAEVLEARDMAGIAYDAAKKAARLATAKGAHDTLVAAAHRAQADALLIESQAKRRLADEYDAAQERGEAATRQTATSPQIQTGELMTLDSIGVPAQRMHEFRQIRDAEVKEPGIVERALNAALERGAEPTRAEVRRAIGPSEYLNKRGAEEERIFIDKRDFKAFCKLWRTMSPGAKELARQFIAGGK